MASSSDPDKDSKDSQSKSENPFIKFRQFADAQIGSLLQGIIGLPSAFSRTQNTRWADFDDDLRRRDELQARQKELKDAAARRSGQQADEVEGEVPAKKSADWDSSSCSYKKQSYMAERDDAATADVPLYSPVTKSLFAHLRQSADDGLEWEEIQETSTNEAFLRQLWPEKSFLNPTRTLQYMSYEDLNRSPLFRSDYSLLPYLLFSPYSPLRLSSSMQPRDEFPYCNAFEDLILVTQGRPMKSPFSRLIGKEPFYNTFGLRSTEPIRNVASSHMDWIHKLRAANILQQKEIQTGRQALLSKAWNSFSRPAWLGNAWLEMLDAENDEVHWDAETEQEMYDRFLHWASSPAALEKAVDSLFTDTSSFIEQHIKARENPDGIRNPADRSKELLFGDVEGYIERKVRELATQGAENTPGEKRSSREWSKDVKKSQESRDSSVLDPDEVVSTRTETERTTHADGSVETSITIWKRFTDGRESTTNTTHIEEPAEDEDEVRYSYEHPQQSELLQQEKLKRQKREEEQKRKNEKKGWFWS
jgi:hypothetical protein